MNKTVIIVVAIIAVVVLIIVFTRKPASSKQDEQKETSLLDVINNAIGVGGNIWDDIWSGKKDKDKPPVIDDGGAGTQA
jgi:EamA domain-containing membrane protein RarD